MDDTAPQSGKNWGGAVESLSLFTHKAQVCMYTAQNLPVHL